MDIKRLTTMRADALEHNDIMTVELIDAIIADDNEPDKLTRPGYVTLDELEAELTMSNGVVEAMLRDTDDWNEGLDAMMEINQATIGVLRRAVRDLSWHIAGGYASEDMERMDACYEIARAVEELDL